MLVAQRKEAVRIGQEMVRTARSNARRKGMMESFLEEFGLSNQEGLALMCLAEALLRVPDPETRDDLIAEKIRSGDWMSHLGQSESWLVNASAWGLALTGRVLGPPASAIRSLRPRPRRSPPPAPSSTRSGRGRGGAVGGGEHDPDRADVVGVEEDAQPQGEPHLLARALHDAEGDVELR